VEHIGPSVAEGHYITWCRGKDGSTWWRADDHKVTVTDVTWVLQRQAYLLFYAVEGSSAGLSRAQAVTRAEGRGSMHGPDRSPLIGPGNCSLDDVTLRYGSFCT
jgi:hypothetical protein